MPRIVVAGGRIAGLEALVALRAHLCPEAETELLEPNAELVEHQRAVVQPFDAGGPRRFAIAASPPTTTSTCAPTGSHPAGTATHEPAIAARASWSAASRTSPTTSAVAG
jgi:hypothetical protein